MGNNKNGMIERITNSPVETMALAAQLAQHLRAGDLLTLAGELGAGKTCFVRGLAEGLGLDPRHVSSPTFVMVQEYGPASGFGLTLVHVDAYRISGPDDLETIGWEELRQGGAIVALEWPEKIAPALPDDRVHVEIEHLDEHMRRVRIHTVDSTRPITLDDEVPN